MKQFSTCHNCSGCSLGLEIKEPPSYPEICAFLKRKAPLITGERTGWRMKAKLAVRGKPSAPLIGLFREGTHDVVDMAGCLANHPSINQAVELLRESIVRQQVMPYSESQNKGDLKYAQFFVCRETGQVQISLVAREKKSMEKLAQDLWAHSQMWHSVWINIQPQPTNQILGNEWHHCLGKKWIMQKTGRCKAAFHPGSFAQANLVLFDRVLENIERWLPENARLLEIYAGTGAISLHLANHWQSALLIEENPYAHLSFQETTGYLEGLKPIRYVQEDAKRAVAYLNEADCIIVDPPRKGLDPGLLEELQRLESKTLIYISCSFKSFQRDSLQLLASGWTIEDATLFWLFPGTDHIEIVTKWRIK